MLNIKMGLPIFMWIKMKEDDFKMLEIRRFLSIRSARRPISSRNREEIIYISDLTGIPIPWITDGKRFDTLFPYDHRVNKIILSSRNILALNSDVNGDERWQIKVYSIDEGKLTHVIGDDENINNIGKWRADGITLGFSSNMRNGVDFDIYLYTYGRGVKGPIIKMDGRNSVEEWMTDEHLLIKHDNTNLDSDIILYNIRKGTIRNLTKHEGEGINASPIKIGDQFLYLTNNDEEYVGIARYNLNTYNWKYLYKTDKDVETFAVSPNGKQVAFTVNDDGFSKLYITNIDLSNIREVKVPEGVIAELSWGKMGLAFAISSPKIGNEIWILKDEKPEQLTYSPKYGLKMTEMVMPEIIRYESWDGMQIPALMYKPEGKAPYPAVLTIHGGPEGQDRPRFQYLPQILVRIGYLVLSPNFRGSRGYGKSFIHLDDGDRRMNSLKDIGALVEWAERRGLIEKGRIAVTGASYGGYATLMSMILYPEYWSCGVERVGIVNMVTFLKNTGAWRRRYRIPEYGDPDRDYEMLMKISPITHVEKIVAPLMIVHGHNDPRVPVTEAEQLVEKLKEKGREAVFIRIGDEGHGIAKVRNRVDIISEIINFIMEHTPLKSES